MNDYTIAAKDFLTALSPEEQKDLYNDLLALKSVYEINKNTSFYNFRNIRRAFKRHVECKKQATHYSSQGNDLMIYQIHEQHGFKNHYKIQVFYNKQEVGFQLVDDFLTVIQKERSHSHTRELAPV